MRPVSIALGSAALLLLAAGSGAAAEGNAATAQLKNAEGKDVGTVELRETASGFVRVFLQGSALPPGEHGFHIHQTGTCDAATGFKSAGGHLAGDKAHGVLSENGPHPGDLPNIHVPDTGSVTFEAFVNRLSIDGGGWFEDVGLFDEDGSAVVVHAGADDYRSQPAGDAGNRIACGVLQKG